MTRTLVIQDLSPDALRPNPWNTNVVSQEMETRIEAGLKQMGGFFKPVVSRRLPDGTLQILGGEHRVRAAKRLKMPTVPVVVLEGVSDKDAKAIGLMDNGRYGQDDSLRLNALLRELDADVVEILPFDEKDLASLFDAPSGVDLDKIGFDEDDDITPEIEKLRPTTTHELMRFKVAVEERESIDKFIQHVVHTRGLGGEKDPMVAAGMALAEIVRAAKTVL